MACAGRVVSDEFIYEFHVGGWLMTKFGPRDGPRFHSQGRFEDIVPNERIVSTEARTASASARPRRFAPWNCASTSAFLLRKAT